MRVTMLLLLLTVSVLPGCAALGPLSPLRPLEVGLVFAQTPAGADGQVPEDDGGVDAWFTTEDGVRLHGRFYEDPQPRAVVLFCHGNAGSLATWAHVGRQLQQRQRVSVLVFDYRGYGRSGGTPTESGVLRDGRAARDWLAAHCGLPASELVLAGRSLGGAVAVDLAADGGARGLVLQSTFSSLPDVASVHVPWLTPHVNMTQRMNSRSKISRYQGPLLQCHGDADRLIPLPLARKLYAAAPGPKQFVVIPDADHIDPLGEDYEQALDAFFDRLGGS